MKKNYVAPEMTDERFVTDDQFMDIASLQVYEEETDEGYAPAEEWSYWVVL
jgi:hypothetical protein